MKKEFEGNHYIHLEMLHIEPYHHTVKLTHILWKEWTYNCVLPYLSGREEPHCRLPPVRPWQTGLRPFGTQIREQAGSLCICSKPLAA